MMKRFKITYLSLAAGLLIGSTGNVTLAKENVGVSGNSNNKVVTVTAADCNPTTAQSDLDINNVRTTILVGGDMWWDLSNAKYEIPIGTGKHSIFAGALWIGGIDAGGQVKVAAQTYRQTGIDFWGGPMDTVTVNITADQCQAYDRHWKTTKDGILAFVAGETSNEEYIKIKNDIESWPGN